MRTRCTHSRSLLTLVALVVAIGLTASSVSVAGPTTPKDDKPAEAVTEPVVTE